MSSRLTTREAYDHLREILASRRTAADVSVEFTRNAKGDTQHSVKVSAPLGTDLDAMYEHAADVAELAAILHDDICEEWYPRADA